MEMNSKIDAYLKDGCGRCRFYQTPQCKVNSWRQELMQLRRIALEGGLTEELKWSQPCYTFAKKNVAIVSALKDYASIAFFKGALLEDSEGILVAPGPSSQASRQVRFTSVQDILNQEVHLRTYLKEAVELEKSGAKIKFNKNPEPIPDELSERFQEDPAFKSAFEGLTPGRQRGYILYFSKPKQAKTRVARIDKYRSKIMKGEGFHDAYKLRKRSS